MHTGSSNEGVSVNGLSVLSETRQVVNNLPVAVNHERHSVEHKVVLTAHRVDVEGVSCPGHPHDVINTLQSVCQSLRGVRVSSKDDEVVFGDVIC